MGNKGYLFSFVYSIQYTRKALRCEDDNYIPCFNKFNIIFSLLIKKFNDLIVGCYKTWTLCTDIDIDSSYYV